MVYGPQSKSLSLHLFNCRKKREKKGKAAFTVFLEGCGWKVPFFASIIFLLEKKKGEKKKRMVVLLQ